MVHSGRTIAIIASTILALSIGTGVLYTATSFPYQYVYFSPLSGGLERAGQRFETDYWGLSVREQTDFLLELERDAEEPIVVSSHFSPKTVDYYLNRESRIAEYRNHLLESIGSSERVPVGERRFEVLPGLDVNDPSVDYYISTTRFNSHLDADGEVIHSVSLRGQLLSVLVRQ